MNNENGIVYSSEATGEHIVLKFKSDAGIRLNGERLTTTKSIDLTTIETLLKKHPNLNLSRLFDQTEEDLDREVASLKAESGQEIPTLSCYYCLTAKNKKQANSLIATLKDHPLVEEVYIEPPAMPASFDTFTVTVNKEIPPATPDFSDKQGYLRKAPAGIDAFHAWTHSGGKGERVQVIDIEGAWNFNHEDLRQNQGGVVGGTPSGDIDWENHGTAVHGEIGGDESTGGIVGIAPKSKFSAVSIFGKGNSSAKAIKMAADRLNKGDIILIELHRTGPKSNGNGQFGFIPIEWWTADFDAIKYATTKGIIVIAAAGNGSQDLDDAVYQNKFDRNQRDSGAILIGAGAPPSGKFGPDRSRLGFSNYGKSIDAQGWGREVTTTGGGDLQGGGNKNKWYTQSFSGTSSASPIVVGAVACLQSIQKTQGGAPLSYTKIREILRTTGSPQTDAPGRPKTERIGNRPDLKTAIPIIKKTQISSGVATKYWLELLAYPKNSTRSLWLFVNSSWKRYDAPNAYISNLVQKAIVDDDSEVKVWYQEGIITGLVTEGS